MDCFVYSNNNSTFLRLKFCRNFYERDLEKMFLHYRLSFVLFKHACLPIMNYAIGN